LLRWSNLFEESPVEWLLEQSNPAVRYFTLRDLLNKDETDKFKLIVEKNLIKEIGINKIRNKKINDIFSI